MGARAALAVAIAVLALTATLAGEVRPSAAGPAPPPSPAPPLVTDQAPLPATVATSPLPSGSSIRLTLTLDFSNASRLARLLTELNDPTSPAYRAFLTPTEFRAEFAPAPGSFGAVEAALRAVGGRSISVAPGRLAVDGVVPAAGVEHLLGVRLVTYRASDGSTVYTSTGTPRLPSALDALVAGVGGLTDRANSALELAAVERPAVPVPEFVTEQGTGVQWAFGSDYAQAFGLTQLWPGSGTLRATYPTGIAIATLLASSYNQSADGGAGVNLPPFDPSVVSAYFNATLGPGWPTPNVTGVPVPVDSVTPPLPGSLGKLTDTSSDEYENSLDLEMAGSLAPGASLYNFYFPASVEANPGATVGDVADDFGLDLAAALSYDYSPNRLAVISGSFGLPEQNDSLWYSGLEEAAALGVTVVSASGDQGDAPSILTGRGSPWPTWPATATFDDMGAISVGGTTVTLDGAPTSTATPEEINATFDSSVTGIATARAWYDGTDPGDYAGSEGGASELFPEPAWQFHSAAQPAIVNATEKQGSYFAGRAGPDVAFPGNNTVAFVFANATGTIYLDVLGGTSVAAPVFAGFLADIVAIDGQRAGAFEPLGFLDPELYRIASFYASPAVRNTTLEDGDPFLDVVSGANFVFSAARGWDAVTGWGEISAPAFLAAINNATIANYVYTGPTPSLPPRPPAPFLTPQTEYYLIAVGALVAIALVIVAARPERRRPGAAPRPSRPQDDPFAVEPAPRPTTGGSSFACPYCGGERPAEPVRCPHCGQL